MHTGVSKFTPAVLFFIFAYSAKYEVDAACKDTNTKFMIPGKGQWTCKKIKRKKKVSYCQDLALDILRSSCPKLCGFCPSKDSKKSFKIQGKAITCAGTGVSGCTGHKASKFKTKCPVTCKSSKKGSDCVLKAQFAHPFEDPDDAPYKGYHGDYLEISKGSTQPADLCDSGTPAAWCLYKNSYEGGTQAYVGNIDDYYTAYLEDCEFLLKETIITRGMKGNMHTFYGYHIYGTQEWYSENDDWSDHMLAAVLKITVMNTGKQVVDEDGVGEWSHPTDKNTLTHIVTEKEEDDETINPDHIGAFSVEVTCDDACGCTASNFKTFHYDPTKDPYYRA